MQAGSSCPQKVAYNPLHAELSRATGKVAAFASSGSGGKPSSQFQKKSGSTLDEMEQSRARRQIMMATRLLCPRSGFDLCRCSRACPCPVASVLRQPRSATAPPPLRPGQNHLLRGLAERERDQVLHICAEPVCGSKHPSDVLCLLLDEGTTLCSIRTMYGILALRGEVWPQAFVPPDSGTHPVLNNQKKKAGTSWPKAPNQVGFGILPAEGPVNGRCCRGPRR